MYNKQLYNKIISDVSLVVKRTINEAFDFDSIEIDNNVHNRICNDFNKRILLVIDGILTGRIKKSTDADPSIIEYINNDAVAIYKVYNKKDLKTLIELCIKIFGNNCNLNWIDTSKITDMSYMFQMSVFNGDISLWDVSNVTDMSYMFVLSYFNGNISNWDVSNVTDMSYMFALSKFNRDVGKWDVSNVTNMNNMFYQSEFNNVISNWDVSNVINMNDMFCDSIFNQDISKWDVSNVEFMRSIFEKSSFTGDISNWNINPKCKIDNMYVDCHIKRKYRAKKRRKKLAESFDFNF